MTSRSPKGPPSEGRRLTIVCYVDPSRQTQIKVSYLRLAVCAAALVIAAVWIVTSVGTFVAVAMSESFRAQLVESWASDTAQIAAAPKAPSVAPLTAPESVAAPAEPDVQIPSSHLQDAPVAEPEALAVEPTVELPAIPAPTAEATAAAPEAVAEPASTPAVVAPSEPPQTPTAAESTPIDTALQQAAEAVAAKAPPPQTVGAALAVKRPSCTVDGASLTCNVDLSARKPDGRQYAGQLYAVATFHTASGLDLMITAPDNLAIDANGNASTAGKGVAFKLAKRSVKTLSFSAPKELSGAFRNVRVLLKVDGFSDPYSASWPVTPAAARVSADQPASSTTNR